MASEVLNLTAQIVMAHASVTELSPRELLQEIKEVYRVLASFPGEAAAAPAPVARPRKRRARKMVESPEAKAIENEEGPAVGDPDYMEFMSSREG
ncbi:MAG: MucR family transcriptional regulator [Desulfobaccales bacterium]